RFILRPSRRPELPVHERRTRGFAGWYFRVGRAAIQHRKAVLLGSLAFLVLGFGTATRLKPQFFPKDHSYLSTVDIWLPEDATVSATHQAVDQVEAVIREVATELEQHPAGHGHGVPRPILRSLTAFVGGGGPRFWNSLNPEPRQS